MRDKPVDSALIASMKRHGTWLAAATLCREYASFAYAKSPSPAIDPFLTRSLSPELAKAIQSPEYEKKVASDAHISRYPQTWATAKLNLKALSDAEVHSGMGTATGVPGRFAGYFEHVEMEQMVEAGLTPMQVIVASTKSGAEFLKAKDLGTLEANKWTDLIVLGASPLENIRNTRRIESVYIAGNRIR